MTIDPIDPELPVDPPEETPEEKAEREAREREERLRRRAERLEKLINSFPWYDQFNYEYQILKAPNENKETGEPILVPEEGETIESIYLPQFRIAELEGPAAGWSPVKKVYETLELAQEAVDKHDRRHRRFSRKFEVLDYVPNSEPTDP